MRARGWRVVAAPPQTFGWLVERVGCVPTASARGLAVVDDNGRLRGMALFDGWTPNSVQAHVAVDTPIAWRALAEAAFSYAFRETGRGVLLGTIVADNTRSLAVARSLGFREVHRVPDGHSPGVDLVLVQMRREECRWLREPCPKRRVA